MSNSPVVLNLFYFESAIDYLKARFHNEKQANPQFSIRKWVAENTFGSHALLFMILNGKRKLSLKHVTAITQGFKFTSAERVFFQTLIQLEQAETEEEKQFFRTWLNELVPGRDHRLATLAHSQVMSDGIHAAIMVMTRIPQLDLSPQAIFKSFQSRYTLEQIAEALERLQNLGYLVQKEGRLQMTADSFTTLPDVTNKPIRLYHKQMAAWGAESIDQQEISERHFQSLTLAIPKKSIPLAKDLLQKFYNQFQTLLMKDQADEVYQLNLHFFRLTDAPLFDGQIVAGEAPALRELSIGAQP